MLLPRTLRTIRAGRRRIKRIASRSLRLEPLEPRELLSIIASETKLLPSEPRADFHAGYPVALNERYAILGEYVPVETQVSAAFVFDVTTGTELWKLQPADRANMEAFGIQVALDGHIGIVGDPEAGSGDRGAAHLFDLRTGQELHKLIASDAQTESDFGYTVEIEGNLAVVGAAWQNGTGAAYLFDVSTGQQLAKIRHADAVTGDHIHALSLEGNVLAIGSSQWYSGGNGAVYLYDVTTPTAPVQLAKIVAPDGQTGHTFGSTANISDTKLLVGTWHDDDYGSYSGAAYLFDISDPQSPQFVSKFSAPDAFAGLQFTNGGVRVHDDLALIGAVYGVNVSGIQTGAAYLYDITDIYAPTLLTKLTPSDGEAADRFGRVALFGEVALVGSPEHDGQGVANSGAAYLYRLNSPPEVTDDVYCVDEDNVLLVTAPGVLENDSDPDGDVLIAVKETDPVPGSVKLNEDGSFTYTPARDFHGTDTFTYRAFDGVDFSESAGTVTITVNSVVDAVVDIKPGSDPNSINLKSRGKLPVAILNTQVEAGEPETFDPAWVDTSTILFGDPSLSGRVSPAHTAFEDVDGDGDTDLIIHFSMSEISRVEALNSDSESAEVTAEVFGGTAIGTDLIGSDSVNIVPQRGKGMTSVTAMEFANQLHMASLENKSPARKKSAADLVLQMELWRFNR